MPELYLPMIETTFISVVINCRAFSYTPNLIKLIILSIRSEALLSLTIIVSVITSEMLIPFYNGTKV